MKLTAREPGMVFSIALHAGLIAFAVVGLSGPKPFDDFAEAVPVDVVSEAQFNELTKGDLKEKTVRPQTPVRVDRVAKIEEQKDPGTAKTDVPTPPPPPLRPMVKEAPEDRDDDKPAPPPKVVIAPPPKPEPPKPEPVKAPPPKAVPKASPDPEEEDRQAEIIRQQRVKADKERAEAEDSRKVEAQRKQARERAEADAKAKAEAEAKARAEEARKAEDKRRAEEIRKADEADKAAEKAAEAKRIADENNRKAAEAVRKAAEAKKALEAKKAAEKAESDKLQAAIRNRLLASRDAPAASGATGQKLTQTASAGVANATGQRLSPSDRSHLMGLIKEQMERCWSVTGMSNPTVKPLVRLQLTPTGHIAVQPALVNTSGDDAFRAIADSGMRAIRACAPYRIPAKFADSFQDWKTITVKLDPSDLF